MTLKRIATLVVLSAAALITAPTINAQHKGEKSVGLRGGFTTRNTTATAGLYFSYRFTEHFRLAPKIDYAFPHHDTDAFSFNIDTEMPIAISGSDRVNFYPIAGLNYSTFSYHFRKTAEDETSDDNSQRQSNFGLGLGAGLEFFATPTLRLAVEGKGIIIKKYSGGWFNISIGYVF